jgi:hypothetical protein
MVVSLTFGLKWILHHERVMYVPTKFKKRKSKGTSTSNISTDVAASRRFIVHNRSNST